MRRRDLHTARTCGPEDPQDAAEHAHRNSDDVRAHVPGNWRRVVRPHDARMVGVVRETALTQPPAGSLSGGGRRPPGARGSHGGPFGADGSGQSSSGPGFATEVPSGGYGWWYLDALSDDGQHALTLIAFIGSVFSPYYALARHRANADPLDYCAVNVALYGPRGSRWALTERGKGAVGRSDTTLRIGPSALVWNGATLTVRIDEITAPFPSRINRRGKAPRQLLQRPIMDSRPRRTSPLAADCATRVGRSRSLATAPALDRLRLPGYQLGRFAARGRIRALGLEPCLVARWPNRGAVRHHRSRNRHRTSVPAIRPARRRSGIAGAPSGRSSVDTLGHLSSRHARNAAMHA